MGRISDNVFFMHIGFTIDSFKKYVSIVEGPFEKELIKIEREYCDMCSSPSEPKTTSYEYHDYLVDDLIDSTIQTREFIQRFRESIIIQLYSFIETELRRLCKHFEHQAQTKFDENLPIWKKRSNLFKFKTFLKKYSSTDLGSIKEFSFIEDLRLLRNNFVHSSSNILDNNRDFKKVVAFSNANYMMQKRLNSIANKKEVWNYEIILNNNYFLTKCINNISLFFEAIEASLC